MALAISDAWDRLQNVYNEFAPDMTFDDPASLEEIEQLEAKLNVTLPEEYKESLRVHSGIGVFPTGELLNTERVYEEWSVWHGLLEKGDIDEEQFANEVNPGDFTGPVKHCMWRKKWIPVVSYGNGDTDCLDLDPGEKGVSGQVFRMFHDSDTRPLLTNSFAEYLDDVATKIQSGYYYFEGGGFSEKVDNSEKS